MGVDLIPGDLSKKFRFEERKHACAILKTDFPKEWRDLIECLSDFTLPRSHIMAPGGGKSPVSSGIDAFFQSRGWMQKAFDVNIVVDGKAFPAPTHKIDNYHNHVGIEVEWNNKTEFYDRDLNNFRLLYDLGILAVGVIITRQTELQLLFDALGKSYHKSTTHFDKLIPNVNGGAAGGCPLLLIGIGTACYDPSA